MTFFNMKALCGIMGPTLQNNWLIRSTFTHLTGLLGGFKVELSLHAFKAGIHSVSLDWTLPRILKHLKTILQIFVSSDLWSEDLQQKSLYERAHVAAVLGLQMWSCVKTWIPATRTELRFSIRRRVGIRNRLRGKWREGGRKEG